MYASTGDRLIVNGTHLGDPVRDGEIIGIRHEDGSPPYLVRWEDTGRESLFFPGPNAVVQHFAASARSAHADARALPGGQSWC